MNAGIATRLILLLEQVVSFYTHKKYVASAKAKGFDIGTKRCGIVNCVVLT